MVTKSLAQNSLQAQRRLHGAALRALGAAWLVALGLAAIGLGHDPGTGYAAPARRAALPDSVVCRLPHKDLSLLDVQRAWYRQEPRYRPPGKGLALRRAFVDQLLEKEALAQAALAEPFVATAPESAQYLTERARTLSQALFQRLVYDSLEVLPEDWEHAREALRGGIGGDTTAAGSDTIGLTASARGNAAERRANRVNAQVRDDLAAAWDDSVAALMAREFAKLPPLRRKVGDGFAIRVTNQVPAFAPADTGRVLVTARGDRLTIGAFLVRFQGIPPTERDYPVTVGQVEARAEQFLGSAWFLREAEARGFERDPAVVHRLAEKREGFALDHWYGRHVATAVDTSDARLRAHYAHDPAPFAIPAHLVTHTAALGDSSAADSMRAALAAGARWEDLCAAHYADVEPRETCARVRNLFESEPDTGLVRTLRDFAPGQAMMRVVPRAFVREYQVWQLVERVAARTRSFEEARSFVVRSLVAEQLEARLQSLVRLLKGHMPVRWNTAALARLDFGPAGGESP